MAASSGWLSTLERLPPPPRRRRTSSSKGKAKGSRQRTSPILTPPASAPAPSTASSFPLALAGSQPAATTLRRPEPSPPPAPAAALWIDCYAPTTAADLAVHKKKVSEVRDWLQQAVGNSAYRSRVLLLTGPAGSGKTAVVRVLARELGVAVSEWVNPVSQESVDFDRAGQPLFPESMMRQFSEFLMRADKYPSLAFGGSDLASQADARKLILLKDFPNAIFFGDNIEKFHKMLWQVSRNGKYPLVMIASNHDSLQYSRVFTKSLLNSGLLCHIHFNPVAQTYLVNALKRISALESKRNRTHFAPPSVATLKAICESAAGDVRSAVHTLEFHCLKKRPRSSTTAVRPANRKRRRKDEPTDSSTSNSKNTSNSGSSASDLLGLGGRDSSLFLFHALGKVLHCKREGPVTTALPKWQASHERSPLALKMPLERTLELACTPATTFNLFLLENFHNFFSDVDEMAQALDYLSNADLLAQWEQTESLSPYVGIVGSLGVMHSNEHPAASKWCPIRKSLARDVETKADTLAEELCDRFTLSLPFYPRDELLHEVLPFAHKIGPPFMSHGDRHAVRRLTAMGAARTSHTLSEMDFTDSYEDEFARQHKAQCAQADAQVTRGDAVEDAPEIVEDIEDFSSDEG
eukprot:m.91017 g.91017  ORF g.91017 m.91017 type:complete len:636 (-) comp8584_c0_seq2:147-2054(-)